MLVDDTNDCSWWKFVQKPDEGFDLGWVSTEQNTDRNECLSKKNEKKSTILVDYQQGNHLIKIRKLPSKPSEWYDFAWLSMKQLTDHNERSPKETHVGYKNGCLSMKQTTDKIDCLSMKPMKW